ncbi:right-handed parallel beta-helix repeat-containing protein [Rufibacter radiotolerans]|uniref:right-handed parallel beta-helix repeat-containing protein n=1 Tax=Rufibacter radiotolerans TaxID=1379910 RepID=UPI0018CD710C|nr:right-handed parallel beta-helix repeat-containing protein [Rufibacter radiotolerans]
MLLFSSLTFLLSCSSTLDPETDQPTPTTPLPVAVAAKGYFLSKNGNDANPGTKELPWRTLEKINSINLEPGETVYLEGGAIFQGTLLLDAEDSGTKQQPITVTSYGIGVATIEGGNKEAAIIKSNFFKLKALHAKGAGRKEGNTTNGIKVERASNGIIEEVTTEGFQKSGLLLYSCKNIEVIKVVAKHNGYSGIYVTGDYTLRGGKYLYPDKEEDCSRNITLRGCTTDNNPGDPTLLDNHSGNGILVEFTKGALVDYCTATNNGWDMPRTGNGPIGIWAASSDSVIIQNCISYRNKTAPGAHDGGGFDFDGGVTNSIIQYCLSYENQGAGYGLYQWNGAMDWDNNTVRYSISINDGINAYGGFTIWNESNDSREFRNAHIYNNIVYNTTSPAVVFFNPSNNEGFGLYNNIFIGQGQIVTGPTSGEKFLGNVYWPTPGNELVFRGFNSLATWAGATGQEKMDGKLIGIYTDPLLAGPFTTTLTDPYQLVKLGGYKLKPDSPLLNKGLDLQSLMKLKVPTSDFFGNKIYQGISPEPGVHELN